MTWEEALDQWRAKLHERSEDTAATWGLTAQRFIREQDPDMRAFGLTQLEAYRLRQAARGISLTTLEIYLRVVKLFLIYCVEHGWMSLDQADIRAMLKTKRVHVEQYFRVLSDEEIRAVLDTANLRQRALICCGLFAGLRAKEIASLRVEHVIQDERLGAFLRVVRGKGQKDRHVPIKPDVYALLRAYIGERPPGLLLFGIKRRAVREAIYRAFAHANIQHATPHCLRHTYAYRLALANVPIIAISKLLGHSNIQMTIRYIDHLTESEVAQYAPSMNI